MADAFIVSRWCEYAAEVERRCTKQTPNELYGDAGAVDGLGDVQSFFNKNVEGG